MPYTRGVEGPAPQSSINLIQMKLKRIVVKETQRINVDLEGKLEDIIDSLQVELDAGWLGIEKYYDGGYDLYSPTVEYYRLYKFRKESDKEYNKRVNLLEKENAKAKEQKLQQLKKELAFLTDEEKKLLGL